MLTFKVILVEYSVVSVEWYGAPWQQEYERIYKEANGKTLVRIDCCDVNTIRKKSQCQEVIFFFLLLFFGVVSSSAQSAVVRIKGVVLNLSCHNVTVS